MTRQTNVYKGIPSSMGMVGIEHGCLNVVYSPGDQDFGLKGGPKRTNKAAELVKQTCPIIKNGNDYLISRKSIKVSS